MNKTGYICLFGVAAVGLLVVGLLVRSQKPVYDLKDDNPAMRAAAVRSMSGEKNKQSLIEALNDPDTDVRLLAIERLGGSGRIGAEALAHLLNDDHAGVRREAAWSLGHIGSDAWPPIKEALEDEKPRVRAGAALALASAYRDKDYDPWPSHEREAIVPILSKLLTDLDPEVRRNAKKALERIGR